MAHPSVMAISSAALIPAHAKQNHGGKGTAAAGPGQRDNPAQADTGGKLILFSNPHDQPCTPGPGQNALPITTSKNEVNNGSPGPGRRDNPLRGFLMRNTKDSNDVEAPNCIGDDITLLAIRGQPNDFFVKNTCNALLRVGHDKPGLPGPGHDKLLSKASFQEQLKKILELPVHRSGKSATNYNKFEDTLKRIIELPDPMSAAEPMQHTMLQQQTRQKRGAPSLVSLETVTPKIVQAAKRVEVPPTITQACTPVFASDSLVQQNLTCEHKPIFIFGSKADNPFVSLETVTPQVVPAAK